MKILYLIRGLPGSGKTTLAKSICNVVFSADDYFTDKDGNYKFDLTKLENAHQNCVNKTTLKMIYGCEKIAVANTFTRDWETEIYFELAKLHGYQVHSIVVENRHNGGSIHNVPEKTIENMRERFEISL